MKLRPCGVERDDTSWRFRQKANLECLIHKVNHFPHRLEFRIVERSQVGHHYQRRLRLLRILEHFKDWNAMVLRVANRAQILGYVDLLCVCSRPLDGFPFLALEIDCVDDIIFLRPDV